MKTRALETKQVERTSVMKAEVLDAKGSSLLFRTAALRATREPGLPRLTFLDDVEGRLRIDVLSDDVLRVRYAPGESLPENETSMVVGKPGGPSRCEIDLSEAQAPVEGAAAVYLATASGGEVNVKTAALDIRIALAPFRIEVRDLDGRKVCGIGGPEKNNFRNWDSFNTGVVYTEDGTALAVENFDLAHDECVYGLGERFQSLNKVGQTVDLNMMESLGTFTPRSYKNVPFFVSNKGYGVFFNYSSLMTYWVGSMNAADVQVAAEDGFLDYYVITGSIKEVLSRYTDITGKGKLPPKWSFGFWQSKISYKAADEALGIARELRKREIPCDVLHLDTFWFREDWRCDLEFDKERFPDPKAFLDEMAEMGFKVCLWQLPYIPEGSKLFDDLKAVGGFVKNPDGSIYDVGICMTPGFKGTVGVVDYTNPEAVRVQGEYFARLFKLGAKVIKVDFGEDAPLDGVYDDGTPGHRMHNRYPLLYNQALFEVTERETGEGVIWARSAWAGSQRYPLHWGGDNSPNFESIPIQLESGLSFGLSGFQFWSQDIGGFMGLTRDKLLTRWMQFGVFNSHSRIHGVGNREIYKFAPETERICTDYIRLRYRLLPYIYGSAMDCVETSLPMLRALVVEYQDDPNVWNIGDEYLFGEGLLVAPVMTDDDRRRVYLPEGMWTDWWDRERIEGPCWLDAEADVETLPLFVREGAIIPLAPWMNYVDERPVEKIELLVSLFEGDGRTKVRVPVNDELVEVEYAAAGGRHTVTVGKSGAEFEVQVLGTGRVEVVRA